MTNEEAVSVLIKTKVMCVSGSVTEWQKAQRLAYQSLEENTKLKAYIARLNGELKSEREWRYNARIELLDKKAEIEQLKDDSKIVAKELVTQIREIDKLKSELQQSIKLPCKVGDVVYVVSPLHTFPKKHIHERKICRFVTINNDWYFETDVFSHKLSEFGVNVFATREEAEQSLKGIL